MKKLSFIIVLLLCFAAGTTADPVTKSVAQQTAEAFMAKRGMKKADGLSLTYQARPRTSNGKAAPAANAFYYVFNNPGQGGFVIVSGDDATEQILGYSDTGSFDSENIPESMQELLDGYQQEISYAREKGLSKTRAVDDDEQLTPTRQVIAPLITSVWNQRNPYNLQCFTTDGQQAVTGCVATALAQVMYYHKWPQSATTAIPAYSSYDALPATTFDWDNMQPAYTEHGAEGDAQKNAVAKLNVYCGHAVQMSYGTGTSGASSSRIPYVLKNYFGYANDATEIYRSDYTPAEWDERIYHELLHQRPVIYSASTSSGSGHAFICDGYDGNGLYHINWGWGGLSDGYFRLQALNPNSQGTGGSSDNGGYSLDQKVIVGISPTVVDDVIESGDDSPTSGIENSDLYLLELEGNTLYENYSGQTTIEYDADRGLYGLYIAYSYRRIDEENPYDVGVGLFKDQEMIDTYIFREGYDGASSLFPTGWGALNYFGTNLSDGTYTIKGIERVSGTDEWKPSIGSDVYNITIEISNGMATAKKVVVQKLKQIELVKVEQDRSSTNPMKLNAYVKNTGEANYDGILYLRCDGNQVTSEGIYLAPGDEDYVTFAFGATDGSHQIVIADNSSGNNPLYSGNLMLEGLPEIPELTKVSEEVKNLVEGNIYGTLFEGSVTLKNATATDYNNQLIIRLWKSKNGTSSSSYGMYSEVRSLSVPAGETVTVPFSFQVAVGDVVIADIMESNTGGHTYYYNGAYTVTAGVVTWTADGRRTVTAPTSNITVGDDVVAIELDEITLDGVTITPNSNPNTLYILAANATTPASLSGKNVVKGYKAADIALQDGYNFFFPRTVMVEGTVAYTRTPAVACNEQKGWSTIVLPFAVKQVTDADNQAKDWRHANDTSDGDFWLREFKGVSDGEVTFADADTWVANRPYVIGVPSDMKDKSLVFSATATKVSPTTMSAIVADGYQFIGTSLDKSLTDAYVMNSEGSAFVPTADATVAAGYAYFNVGAATLPDLIPISTGGLKGDVNGDGVVDISDVTLLVNYILGKTSDGIVLENSDMNDDGRYDVTDLTLICNVILGKI